MAHTYTWAKLVQNAYRLNPKSRGPKYPYSPKFEVQIFTSGPNKGQATIIPYVGTKSLLIGLRAWGVTQASLHSVSLLFHDVEILTEDPKNMNYFPIQYNNQMYWCKKLDQRRNPLTSRCSCKDEFFTWAYYKYNAGCLYGTKPKMYVRKTTWMPPRNPNGLIGCCKHVYNAWAYLKGSGFTIN